MSRRVSLKSVDFAPPPFVRVIISVPAPVTSIFGTEPFMSRISSGASGTFPTTFIVMDVTIESKNIFTSSSHIPTPSDKQVYSCELKSDPVAPELPLQSRSKYMEQSKGVYSHIDVIQIPSIGSKLQIGSMDPSIKLMATKLWA